MVTAELMAQWRNKSLCATSCFSSAWSLFFPGSQAALTNQMQSNIIKCNAIVSFSFAGRVYFSSHATRGHMDMRLNSLLSIWVSKKWLRSFPRSMNRHHVPATLHSLLETRKIILCLLCGAGTVAEKRSPFYACLFYGIVHFSSWAVTALSLI